MYPSSRFEVLLYEQGARLVSSSQLLSEFNKGRIPIYAMEKMKMSRGERAYTERIKSDTIWVTQKICNKPIIHHRMFEKNGKTIFEIGTGNLPLVDSRMKREISDCLRELINVCTATKIKTVELMTMSECLLCLRLMNDITDRYQYSKLLLFDEGTIVIAPQNKEISDYFYRYVLSKTNRVRPKMIRATKDICYRFLYSLKRGSANEEA